MKLKASDIDKISPLERRIETPDGNDLFLNINPTGKKSWTAKFTHCNQRLQLEIGKYPEIKIRDARRINSAIQLLAIHGFNPAKLSDTYLLHHEKHFVQDENNNYQACTETSQNNITSNELLNTAPVAKAIRTHRNPSLILLRTSRKAPKKSEVTVVPRKKRLWVKNVATKTTSQEDNNLH